MNQRAGGKDPPSDRTDLRRLGLGSRPVVWAAFALSAALHVVLVLIYSSVGQQIRPDAAAFPFSAASRAPQGIDVIRLLEVDEIIATDRPEDPEEIENVDEPQVEVVRTVIGQAPVVELLPPGPSAAERLRPNLTNARLWAPLDPRYTDLTPEQREELVIAGRLTEWYDSVAAVVAAEAAATDWTFTDSDGGRWGISPGQIHLGGITIPLPLAFGIPVGMRDEANRRVWQWEEIARQGARVEVQETLRERTEAIRARRDRERAAARADTLGAFR